MRKLFGPMGSIKRLTIESELLKENVLGNPTARAVDVYVPAAHDGRGLPLLVDLVGTASSGLSQTNWVGFRENMPERLDRLIGEQRLLRRAPARAAPQSAWHCAPLRGVSGQS